MTTTPIRPPCPTRQAMELMWRPIPGFEGYEAGFDGRVRNTATGHVLKPQQAKGGRYRKVTLYGGDRPTQRQVHQLVCEAWHPRPDTGMPLVVDHRDNDGTRNCVTNLRWLTYSMNTRQWYAMAARYAEHGLECGYDLEPAVPDEVWEDEFTRLKAAGL